MPPRLLSALGGMGWRRCGDTASLQLDLRHAATAAAYQGSVLGSWPHLLTAQGCLGAPVPPLTAIVGSHPCSNSSENKTKPEHAITQGTESPLPYLCETRIRTVMAINRRVPLQHPTTTTTARCRRLNHD